MNAISPSPAIPSSFDRYAAYFYSGLAIYGVGGTIWRIKKFFNDNSYQNGMDLFVYSVYVCATTVTALFNANKVQWIFLAVPHKFERTLNFSSLILQTITGEHALKVRTPGVDPHPMIRVAFVVTTVVFAILEVIVLFYANPVINALYYTVLAANLGLMATGIYLAPPMPPRTPPPSRCRASSRPV